VKRPTKKKDKSRIKSGTIETPPGTTENPEDHPDDVIQEKTQEDIDREWRCLTCSATAPSTTSGYMTLIKHQCTGKKKIRMIALENNEELAGSLKEAQAAGLLGKLKEEESPGKESDSPRGGPQITDDNNIRITITLPIIDLARFNITGRTSESG
jgi:hypothetical protein